MQTVLFSAVAYTTFLSWWMAALSDCQTQGETKQFPECLNCCYSPDPTTLDCHTRAVTYWESKAGVVKGMACGPKQAQTFHANLILFIGNYVVIVFARFAWHQLAQHLLLECGYLHLNLFLFTGTLHWFHTMEPMQGQQAYTEKVLGSSPRGTAYLAPPVGQPVEADTLLTKEFPQCGINNVF